MSEREFRNRLIRRFRKKTVGFVTLHIDKDLKYAIRIYYAYGGRYHLKRVRKGKKTDLNLHDDFDGIYQIIISEEELARQERLSKKLKSKQLSLF